MIRVFTDGACSGNPGPGGWAARIEDLDRRQLVELGGKDLKTTNNRMELLAAVEALNFIASSRGDADVDVYTDSQYMIQGITSWLAGWKRKGWRTKEGAAVLNRDLWERLDAANDKLAVTWNYVRGHVGHRGNERVDFLARKFAASVQKKGEEPELLAQDLTDGEISPPPGKEAPRAAGPAKPAGPAFGYLALVDGSLKLFAKWPDCQRFVHGRSNARFKKVGSEGEARALAASWGARPDTLTRE